MKKLSIKTKGTILSVLILLFMLFVWHLATTPKKVSAPTVSATTSEYDALMGISGYDKLKNNPFPGSVIASDAYIPFPDSVEACARVGVRAIAQSYGSERDHLSIDAANKYGIAMVFTGIRHFKH